MFTSKLKVKYIKGSKPREYSLEAPLIYGDFIVPINTRTDFASVPMWLYWLFKPQSKGYSKSSVLHDCLYYSHLGKLKSDWIFLNAMKSEQSQLKNKTKWFLTRWTFYLGVSFGGWLRYWECQK